MSKHGKMVVVGGTSGIGEATARQFAREGGEAIVTGRDRARLKEALARLPGVRGETFDGTDAAAAKRFFEQLGRFEHLVLALSGGKGAGPIAGLSLDELRAGFEAKLFPQLAVLQSALEFITSSITFVSASSARVAVAGTAGLAAINGAIEAMVPPLASELAPLRVNAVSPGVIDTPWWDAMPKDVKDGYFAQAKDRLPVKRVGQPEDVARAIVLLATNPFITGTVLPVNGGFDLARG